MTEEDLSYFGDFPDVDFLSEWSFSPNSSSSSSSSSSSEKLTKHRRQTKKEEIAQLKKEALRLENILLRNQNQQLHRNQTSCRWEKSARHLIVQYAKARQLNNQLRRETEKQQQRLAAITSLLQPSTAAEKDASSGRCDRVHQMYTKLTQIMVQTGFLDIQKDMSSCILKPIDGSTMKEIELLRHRYVEGLNYSLLGNVAYRCFRGDLLSSFKIRTGISRVSILEEIDNHTCCIRYYSESSLGFLTECKTVLRRFIEKNRIVLCLQSVAHDEIIPPDPKKAIFSFSIWFIIDNESQQGKKNTRIKIISRVTPDKDFLSEQFLNFLISYMQDLFIKYEQLMERTCKFEGE